MAGLGVCGPSLGPRPEAARLRLRNERLKVSVKEPRSPLHPPLRPPRHARSDAGPQSLGAQCVEDQGPPPVPQVTRWVCLRLRVVGRRKSRWSACKVPLPQSRKSLNRPKIRRRGEIFRPYSTVNLRPENTAKLQDKPSLQHCKSIVHAPASDFGQIWPTFRQFGPRLGQFCNCGPHWPNFRRVWPKSVVALLPDRPRR